VLRSEAGAFQNEKAKTEENDVVRVAAPAASEGAAAKEGCPLHVRCLPHTYLPLLVGDYDYDYDDDDSDGDDDDDDYDDNNDDDDDDYDDNNDDDGDGDDGVSPPLLVARVQVARYSGKTLPVSAEICFLRSGATGQRWRWTLSSRSFEAVHLLWRVASMTADKLLTASLLNLDDLPDKGGLLIRELEDLLLQPGGSGPRLRELRALEAAELTLRRQRAYGPSPPTEGEEPRGNGLRGENCLEFSTGAYGFLTSEHSPVEISGPERSLDQVVDWFASRLVGFREFLARRPGPSRVSSWAEATVEMAAEILACCQAYLHFVHPVWRELEETGGMTRARHEELAFAATRKVEASRKLAFDGVSFDIEIAGRAPGAPEAPRSPQNV
jgi:hypothetical protein